MGWADLIESADARVVAPWLGDRTLGLGARRWELVGRRPAEHGWYAFATQGRRAWLKSMESGVVPEADALRWRVRGIPIGDRFVADDARVPVDEADLLAACEPLHLLDAGLGRFQAVYAGRAYEGGPLVYAQPALPDDAASEVLRVWEDGGRDLGAVRGVTPALELAFRLLWQQRDEAEGLRRAAEQERERRALLERVGTAEGRRSLAAVDFPAAAGAALEAGGAELLDTKPGPNRGEMVVRFRTASLRFECVCDAATLQILDAGICLREAGRVWDRVLTLESLPSVVREAIATRRLHVYRPVDARGTYDLRDRDDEDDEDER